MNPESYALGSRLGFVALGEQKVFDIGDWTP